MSIATQLAAIKSTALARIIAIQAEIADGDIRKPSYSVEGRSVQWADHRRALLDEMKAMQDQMKWVNEQAADESGPLESLVGSYSSG